MVDISMLLKCFILFLELCQIVHLIEASASAEAESVYFKSSPSGQPLSWNLPLLPNDFFTPTEPYRNKHSQFSPHKPTGGPKLIPRILWISFRHVPMNLETNLHPHLADMLNRSFYEGWTTHLMGEEEQLSFLDAYYPNSSLLWATMAIHPDAGVSQSDIWRYACLYKFGGVYLDDDSYFRRSLEHTPDAIRCHDTLILTIEKNKFGNNCYRRSYRLNHDNMLNNPAAPLPKPIEKIFGGRVLANWGMFAAPHHSVLRRTLANIVDVVASEFRRNAALYMLPAEPRWKAVHCATGPQMLTSSVYEELLLLSAAGPYSADSSAFDNSSILRTMDVDFKPLDGEFKVSSEEKYMPKTHYMVLMNQRNTPLLRVYEPLTNKTLATLDCTPVMGTGSGRGIYLLVEGQLRAFPHMDSFAAHGFIMTDVYTVLSVDEWQLLMRAEGPWLSDIPDTQLALRLQRARQKWRASPSTLSDVTVDLRLNSSGHTNSIREADIFTKNTVVKSSVFSSHNTFWGQRKMFADKICVWVVDIDALYFASGNSTGILQLVPDEHTAGRLGIFNRTEDCNAVPSLPNLTSLAASLKYPIGPTLPSLIPVDNSPDEITRIEVLRILLLQSQVIAATRKLGAYFNPCIIPLPCSDKGENSGGMCGLMTYRGKRFRDGNSYIQWIDIEKSKLKGKDRSMVGLRLEELGHLTKAEDIRLLMTPLSEDQQAAGNKGTLPPGLSPGNLLLIMTINDGMTKKLYFGHMAMSSLVYNSSTRTLQLTPQVRLEPSREVAPVRNDMEKNWSPFVYAGTLHFVYHFHPFHVVRLGPTNTTADGVKTVYVETVSKAKCPGDARDRAAHSGGPFSNRKLSSAQMTNSGSAKLHYHTHTHSGGHTSQFLMWEYGHIRGGTPALLLSRVNFETDCYLAFFHSRKVIHPHERGLKPRDTYFMGAYLFSAAPPFVPLALSRVPILVEEYYQGKWCVPSVDYVVYPVGYYLSESMDPTYPPPAVEKHGEGYTVTEQTVVHMSMGRNDEEGWLVQLPLGKLLSSLVPYSTIAC